MESQRITVSEAARILGVSQDEVRFRMRNGTFPIGSVLPPKKGGTHRRYLIFKEKLMNYVGLTEWPEEVKTK